MTGLPRLASLSPWGAARRAGAGTRAGTWLTRRAAVWLWLLLLGTLCLAETVTHLGARNGFLESSRPLYSAYGAAEHLPADGYVSWVGTVPVLQDAESFLNLGAFFLGQQGPGGTGFLDRRAAYAYLAALLVPWLRCEGGSYAAFVGVSLGLWWAAAAAMFWLVRRRTDDTPLAVAASFLVATGQGMVFMVGLPQSYVAAYASLVLLLALAEWLDVWRPPHRLGPWLLLGWGAGVASTIYFTHFAVAVFWWAYGARRIPWRYLLAATALAFGIGALWEVYGQALAGLRFSADNSSLVAAATRRWASQGQVSWEALVTFMRSSNAGGTILGAFPLAWWPFVVLGLVVSPREDQEWSLAVLLSGLVPMIAMLGILSLPRIAYFMFPAVYFLAARGALWLARAAGRWLLRRHVPPPAARAAGLALATAALAVLALQGNADLFGYQEWNARFHYAVELGR